MRRPPAFHPLLVAAFPALFVCSQNVEQFSAGVLWTSALALVVMCAVAWAVAGLATRDARKGALIASLFFLLAFSFTAARSVLPQFTWTVFGWPIGPRKLTFAVWVLLLVGGSWLTLRTRRDLGNLTRVLNVAALVLVLIPASHIAWYRARHGWPAPAAPAVADEDEQTVPTRTTPPPDIYLIIMDSYAREDTLRDLYHYDNSDFIAWLRQKGFYVADRSTSNYSFTYLAVPCILNMNYAGAFMPPLDPETSTDVFMMTQFVKDSRVERFLRKRGYKIIVFQTGFSVTDVTSADEFLIPGWFCDEFANTLVDMTPLGAIFYSMDRDDNHRKRVLYLFDRLKTLPLRSGPKFVYAHFMAPHRPFVFGRDGEPVDARRLYWPDCVWPTPEQGVEYRRFYRNEVVFLNRKLRATIDAILRKSARPPVILLLGDHGPESLLSDPVHPSDDGLRERFRNLQACYLAGETDNAFYPGITYVNTFRVILNHVFGTRYAQLDDRNYLTLELPFKLADVTDRVVEGRIGTPPQGDNHP
jgi:hypothetical protein